MQLLPDETYLTGHWEIRGNAVVADEACRRIKQLIAEQLNRIAVAGGGWEILYQDPADGRLWELTYPQGEMQGGGPPSLGVLSAGQARAKYQWPAPGIPAV